VPRIPAFYSAYEISKPPSMRVYHTNDACPLGRAIAERERVPGIGNHPLCRECERLNRTEPNPWI